MNPLNQYKKMGPQHTQPAWKQPTIRNPIMITTPEQAKSWRALAQKGIASIQQARKDRMDKAEDIFMKGVLAGNLQQGTVDFTTSVKSNPHANEFLQHCFKHALHAYSTKLKELEAIERVLEMVEQAGGEVKLEPEQVDAVRTMSRSEALDAIDKKFYRELEACAAGKSLPRPPGAMSWNNDLIDPF